MRELIQKIYFHGSERHGITELDPIHSDVIRPFGKAVYLSAEKATAMCYVKGIGSLYRVQIQGNPAFTINLDAPFGKQSIEARERIRRIIKSLNPNYSDWGSETDARALIGGNHRDTRDQMTEQLLKEEIWMIYGTVCPVYEHSGPKDDGIQYAVLDRKHLSILGEERCDRGS